MAKQTKIAFAKQKEKIKERLDNVGWALFFIMIGLLWLMPDRVLPPDTWLVGTGAIILAVNLARYVNGIKMNGVFIVIGLIALALGLDSFIGIDLPFFAILFIAIGLCIILSPLFKTDED